MVTAPKWPGFYMHVFMSVCLDKHFLFLLLKENKMKVQVLYCAVGLKAPEYSLV